VNELEQLARLGTALAIGLLVGIERGWQEREAEEGGRVAGVRTFGLIGLLGGLIGLVGVESHTALIPTGYVAITAVLTVAYAITAKQGDDVGITSLVAGLLTFAFGVLAALGHLAVAAAGGVVTTLILGVKPLLHSWLQKLTHTELKALIKLLLISVVLLPVLPNQGYGPWETLNPYTIWWMVVLVASISFAGYFAMKTTGKRRGAALTGLFGGLASSTALTLHFSRLARGRKLSLPLVGFGVLIACGTMFPRVVLITSVINRALVPHLVLPLALMGAVVYGSSFLMWRASGGESDEDDSPAAVQNPLELGSALRFGALLAVVMVAAEGLKRSFGDSGLLVLAGVSGLTDVDAITLSLTEMSTKDLAADVAITGIVLAAAANTLVKGTLSVIIGGAALGKHVLTPLALAAVTGLAWIWLM
jgi:uncharacterized membrane protein (DUF4010 family)